MTTPAPKMTHGRKNDFPVVHGAGRRPDPPRPAACFQNPATGLCRCPPPPAVNNDTAPKTTATATHETAARHSPRAQNTQRSPAGPRRNERHDALFKGIRHPVVRRVAAGRRRSVFFAVQRDSYTLIIIDALRLCGVTNTCLWSFAPEFSAFRRARETPGLSPAAPTSR